MSPESLLLGLAVAVASAEYSSLLEWVARRLVRCAVRLSHGRTPRAEIRLREMTGDLLRCPGQIAKLLYALGLAWRGVIEWLWQLTGRSCVPDWGAAGQGQIFAAVKAISDTFQDFGGDIRSLSSAERKEFGHHATRLGTLLRHPAAVADDQTAEMLAFTTASVCQAYIDDRDERAAVSLVEAADPLGERLGRHHPALFGLRRCRAAAVLARGDHRKARTLLHSLMIEEAEHFGERDGRTCMTTQLYAWSLRSAGRIAEAEARLAEIESVHIRDADPRVLLHNRCKRFWTIGEQHRVRESAEGYDAVIADRAHLLGPHHADTLDSRHSKGKMLVQNGEGLAAYPVLRPLAPDMRRVFGVRHAYTLENRKYLALARTFALPHSRRVRRRARRELRRVLRVQVRVHGPDYPDTRDTRDWLATLVDPTEQP